MCGIYLSLSRRNHVLPNEETRELLRRRGPDSVRELRLEIPVTKTAADASDNDGSHDTVYITCISTVLSLRGQHTTPQPVTDQNTQDDGAASSFLCWNGEAWRFAGAALTGNDSEQVFHVLSHLCQSIFSWAPDAHEHAVSEVMATFAGPFAFAFFDHRRQRLYFSRDLLGRRSLLMRTTSDGDLVLSSVSNARDVSEQGWTEVEADGICWTDVGHGARDRGFVVNKTSYLYSQDGNAGDRKLALRPLVLNKTLPSQHLDLGVSCTCLNSASQSVSTLERLLRRSLSVRIKTIPRRPQPEYLASPINSAKLAVLFSGGLDCTVLARLAHDFLDADEAIDLLNVAFQNPRVHGHATNTDDQQASPYEQCPDRITGRASFAELQIVCPSRKWRFVAVNVPYAETLFHRPVVMTLMHPHNTEMDLSIASALYFAARGSGWVRQDDGTTITYETDARVLLSGLGADELFGGYTRHATAFARRSYSGLLDELELDISRLGKRNLGRDDRIISTWAREARFPFLDEELVNWALSTSVWEKCDFGAASLSSTEDDGSASLEPGKKVLRCLAWKLGMTKVASEKKRAIQFGARTAKMEVGRTKGTRILT